ncbi:MAG TPA: PKD domain-containing protein [Ktedonobacterales bacterium]
MRLSRLGIAVVAAVACVLALGSRGTAWACGLGSPTATMLANGTPALAFPVKTNVSFDQPIGIFSLSYIAKQQIAFDEDTSLLLNAPPRDSYKLRWSFGDGTAYSYIQQPAHTFAKAGTYNVHTQIYDPTDGSWQPFDSAQIHLVTALPANPPTAVIDVATTSYALNADVVFDASKSHAVDGSALTYSWNFDDASPVVSGQRVTHQFANIGKGLIALTVTDAHGATGVASLKINVVQELPKASLTAGARTVTPGATVSFDAGASSPPTSPPGDTLVNFTWDFGDGTPLQTTQEPTTSHRFVRAGDYTVTVGAVEQAGAAGTATLVIHVVAAGATSSGGNATPLLAGIGLVVAIILGIIGYQAWQGERARRELVHQQQMARELSRARRVNSSSKHR